MGCRGAPKVRTWRRPATVLAEENHVGLLRQQARCKGGRKRVSVASGRESGPTVWCVACVHCVSEPWNEVIDNGFPQFR